MKQVNKYILSGVITLLSCSLKSQDIHFSQYIETPTTLNPALMGQTYDTRVIANYRNQWSSISSKAYNTMGLSYDGGTGKKLKGSRIGWGLNIMRDVAGDAKLNSLLPSAGISFGQQINRKMRASAGFQFGLNYRTIEYNNMRWGSQYQNYEYNSSIPTGESTPRGSVLSTDVGAGAHFSYAQSQKYISSKDGSKFDIGFAAYHFSIPKNSFIVTSEKLNTRVVVYSSGEFFIPHLRIAIDPSVIYLRQGKSQEFITGLMFKYVIVDESKFTSIKKPSAVSIGASYRYKDAIIPALLIQYDKYALGFAYDINVSQLTPASQLQGGMEIMLRYNVSAGYGKNLGRTDTKASY